MQLVGDQRVPFAFSERTWSLCAYGCYATVLTLNFCAKLRRQLMLDEALSYYQVANKSFTELIHSFYSATNVLPYPYFFLLWIEDRIFGLNIISLRTPSLIFSILAIIVLHVVIRNSFGGVIAFFVCTALIIISYDFLLYSTIARPYSLYLFTAIFAVMTASLLLEQGPSIGWKPWLLNAIAAFALPASHYVGLLYAAAVAAGLILASWRHRSTYWLAIVLLSYGVGWAVFLGIHLDQLVIVWRGEGALRADWVPISRQPMRAIANVNVLFPLILGVLLIFTRIVFLPKLSQEGVTTNKKTPSQYGGSQLLLFYTSILWLIMPLFVVMLGTMGGFNISRARYFVPSIMAVGIASAIILHYFLYTSRFIGYNRPWLNSTIACIAILVIIVSSWSAGKALWRYKSLWPNPPRFVDNIEFQGPLVSNNIHLYFVSIFYSAAAHQIYLLRGKRSEVEKLSQFSKDVKSITVHDLTEMDEFRYLYRKGSINSMPGFDIEAWARENRYTIIKKDQPGGVSVYDLAKSS